MNIALAGAVTTLLLVPFAFIWYRTRSRREQERLRRDQDLRARMLALFDVDTGLRNRASFQQEIVKLIQQSRRETRQFDLFYGSLRFPELPPDRVDEAMSALAVRLKPLARDGDFLARHSKTEFTMLRPRRFLRDLPDPVLVQQLLTACTGPLRIGDREIQPQAHVGVGTFPDHGQSSRDLLAAAAKVPAKELQFRSEAA